MSPALNTFTISPIQISLAKIYSALCKVAEVIIEPSISTGESLAT
jgi:hypothetical protein